MTTQELKEYIGRVLGNSIRCLLPSYWWKRLFGLVVDKVEDIEDKVSDLSAAVENSGSSDIAERTFYYTNAAGSEAAQKNLALAEKLGKEVSNTIIKPVYIAYYMYNYFPTTVAQWGILGLEAGAGELIRFYDVFTSSMDSKYKIDLVLMTDGTMEIRDSYFSVKGDLELKKNAKTPLANATATEEFYQSARSIRIPPSGNPADVLADNAKVYSSIRDFSVYRPVVITDYGTTYMVTSRELTGGSGDPIRFIGITYNNQYGEYDLRYIQILLNADGTIDEEKKGLIFENVQS